KRGRRKAGARRAHASPRGDAMKSLVARSCNPGGAVLLVEAYSPLAKPLMLALAEEGFVVRLARDDEQANALAHATRYAAFLVDWNVPRKGGLALVRRWREEGLAVPVLLLDSSASNAR